MEHPSFKDAKSTNENFVSDGLAIITLMIGIVNYFSIAELNSSIEEDRKERVQSNMKESLEEEHYVLAKTIDWLLNVNMQRLRLRELKHSLIKFLENRYPLQRK